MRSRAVFCSLLTAVTFASLSTLSSGVTSISTTSRRLTYWVSFSRAVSFPPLDLISVSVFTQNVTGPFSVGFTLMKTASNNTEGEQTMYTYGTDRIRNIRFRVGAFDPGAASTFYLRVRARGSVEFDSIEPMRQRFVYPLSVFLQTDKTTYQRGQTVKFRAVALLASNLQLTDETISFFVMDPNNKQIARWSQIGDKLGVYEGEVPLSRFASFGRWSITAYKTDYAYAVKHFTVVEHEQPWFQVNVVFPKYPTRDDEKLVGKVIAKYAFGPPVKGNGTVVAKMLSNGDTQPVSLVKQFTLDKSGETNVEFTNKELQKLAVDTTYYGQKFPKRAKKFFNLYGRDFVFSFTIVDRFSNESLTAYASVKIGDDTKHPQIIRPYPDCYKPGLPMTFHARAFEPDKVTPIADAQDLNLTMAFIIKTLDPFALIEKTVVPVNRNGIARFTSVPISEKMASDTRISVSAMLERSSVSLVFGPCLSPSESFLHLQLKTDIPTVGDYVELDALSNVNFGDLMLQVYSKDALVLVERIPKQLKSNVTKIRFKLTSSMVPLAEVLASYVTEDGEVVADKEYVETSTFAASEVTLKFNKAEVKPGGKVNLVVKAPKGSTVFVMGVDSRMRPHDTANDITLEYVMSELARQESTRHLRSVKDAYSVFQAAEAGIITDAWIPNLDVPGQGRRRKRSADIVKDTVAAVRLAKYFSDTWLWTSVSMKNKDRRVLKLKAPTNMATWEVTAFAVHPELGLFLTRAPIQLETTKRLFAELIVPTTAVVGEVVCFTALTFNQYDVPVNVSVVLAKDTSAFEGLLITRKSEFYDEVTEIQQPRRMEKDLGEMQPHSAASTVFCIKPITAGDLPVTVFPKADLRSSRTVKTIKVKQEDIQRTQTYPVLIEIPEGQGENFTHTVNISLPDNFLNGSAKMSVSVVGDVMGGVLDHMEDLLDLPYGRAEEIMKMAISTHLLHYLEKTGRLSSEMRDKAAAFVVQGYETLSRFERKDNFYSYFGDDDPKGSTWLTALILKSVVQAEELISNTPPFRPSYLRQIDRSLPKRQSTDGSFYEDGPVTHRAMQSGLVGRIRLTAFVTIAVREGLNRRLGRVPITRAVSYLEGQLSNISDSYTACIVAYALTLTRSRKAVEAQQLMERHATEADGLKYWFWQDDVTPTSYPWNRKIDPLSIEMTSYAIMTYMKDGKLTDAVPSFKWLMKQRGPNGGFISPQDTILAFEALSSLTGLALEENFAPVDVTVAWTPVDPCKRRPHKANPTTVTIDEDSLLMRRTIGVPVKDDEYTRQVHISATTTGLERVFVLAQVTATYSTRPRGTVGGTFYTQVLTNRRRPTSYVQKTCLKRRRNLGSLLPTLVVVEIGVASGYEVIIQRSPDSSKYLEFKGRMGQVEFGEDKVILRYISEDISERECVLVKMGLKTNKGAVFSLKRVPVKMYDYNNPDDEITNYYTIRRSDACEILPQYCSPTPADGEK